MNIYQTVKEHVTTIDTARFYGIRISGKDKIKCIFHNDHNPSMKVDRRYYCFGCQETGDVIDFVAQMFGLGPYDAARKLAEDFGIMIDENVSISTAAAPHPKNKKRSKIITTIKAYRALAFEWKRAYQPCSDDPDSISSLYVFGCHNLDALDAAFDEVNELPDIPDDSTIAFYEKEILIYGRKIERFLREAGYEDGAGDDYYDRIIRYGLQSSNCYR